MKKWLSLLLVFGLSLLLFGCSCDDKVIEVTSVEIGSNAKELQVGQTYQINPTVKPDNATDKKVTYDSDNKAVATVSASGLVSAVAEGTAVITVKAGAKQAELTITVLPEEEVQLVITVPQEAATIVVGGTYTLGAQVKDQTGAPQTATLAYASNNEDVATVDDSGKVTGHAAGTAVITITSGELSKTVTITVTEEGLGERAIAGVPEEDPENNVYIFIGRKFTATVENLREGETVAWNTQDTEVISLSAEGAVEALEAGIATIHAIVSDAEGNQVADLSATFEVMDESILPLFVSEPGYTLKREEIAVEYSANYKTNKVDPVTQDVIYKVEDITDPENPVELGQNYEANEQEIPAEDIAEVLTFVIAADGTSKTGVNRGRLRVVALKPGLLRITAKVGEETSEPFELRLIDRPMPTELVISAPNDDPQIETKGGSLKLSVSSKPSFSYSTVTWSSNNPLVDVRTDGTIICNGTDDDIGTVVTITATSTVVEGLTTTIDITIKEKFVEEIKTPEPTSITINGYPDVFIGETYQFTADVGPAGANQTVVWSSQQDAYASVDENGLVTVHAAGEGKSFYIIARAPSVENPGTYAVTQRYQIRAAKPPVDPDPINLNGYNITIMNASHALFDQDPFLPQYAGADKTAKQAAWREVEEAYNCTISVVAYPEEAPWGPARVQWINNNANNTKGGADYYIATTTWLNQFSASQALFPVQDLYIRFGKNSMDPASREAATYKGNLFAMSASTYGANYIDRGLFYNVNLLEEVGMENPAQMFMSDRWHHSDFEQWVLDAQVAIGQKGEGYYAISGRPFFYWAGMINVAGIKMVDSASASLNVDGPIQRSVVNVLKRIYMNHQAWDPTPGYDALTEAFRTEKAIMDGGEMWFVKTDNRWPIDMWSPGDPSGTRYGYVPFPYPDSMSKDQTKVITKGGSIYSMVNHMTHKHAAAGLTDDAVAYEGIYRALNDVFRWTERKQKEAGEMVGETELDVRRQNASLRLDDPFSIECVLFYDKRRVMYDPYEEVIGIWATPSAARPAEEGIRQGADYSAVVAECMPAWQQKVIAQFG